MKWVAGKSDFQGRGIRIDPLADWLFQQRPYRSGKTSNAPIGAKETDPDEKLTLHVLVRLAAGRTAKDLAEFVIDGNRPADDEVIYGDVTAKEWRRSIRVPSQYTEASGDWRRHATAPRD